MSENYIPDERMSKEEEEKMQIDFAEAMYGYEEYRRKRAIKALFQKSSWSVYDLSDYNYVVRIFSWIKTLICLLLKRTGGSYLHKHYFCILAYDKCQGYEGTSWEAVFISPKLFSGWQVCVCSDGT